MSATVSKKLVITDDALDELVVEVTPNNGDTVATVGSCDDDFIVHLTAEDAKALCAFLANEVLA